MAMETAIQGFGILQKALEGREERKLKRELVASEQEFQAGESEKQRKSALDLAKVQQGPRWAEIRMSQDRIRKAEEAGKTLAEELEASSVGETATGKGLIGLARQGEIASALNGLSGSRQQIMMQLSEKAAMTQDPILRDKYNKILNSYFTLSENEAYSQRAADVWAQSFGDDKTISYTYNPQPAWGGITKILAEKLNYEVGEEPLAVAIQNKEDKEPGYWLRNREDIIASIASEIRNTDPKLQDRPEIAYRAAQVMLETIFTGGASGVLVPKQINEKGEPEYDYGFKGFKTIPIELKRSTFIQMETPRKELPSSVVPEPEDMGLELDNTTIETPSGNIEIPEMKTETEQIDFLNKVKNNLKNDRVLNNAKEVAKISKQLSSIMPANLIAKFLYPTNK